MAYSTLELRPHVRPTEQVHGLIAPSHCWHFDAWLYPLTGDALALLIETRAGGRELLTSHVYSWDGDRLRYLALTADDLRAMVQPITMQDRAYVSRFVELNNLHAWVLPMAARVPSGYRSRSVALHYVRAPSLEPFEDDALNLSQF